MVGRGRGDRAQRRGDAEKRKREGREGDGNVSIRWDSATMGRICLPGARIP
jgi:hypothetical protein